MTAPHPSLRSHRLERRARPRPVNLYDHVDLFGIQVSDGTWEEWQLWNAIHAQMESAELIGSDHAADSNRNLGPT